MAYVITDPVIGYPAIGSTATVAALPMGTVVQAKATGTDTTPGSGRFIYLKGVTATVTGIIVTYNQLTGATTLVPSTANLGSPLAVAMGAVTTGLYGWYQIGGSAVIKKTAVKVSPGVKLYISGTTGRLMSTAASGKQVLELVTINAATVLSATSTITALIQYPVAQGATA